MKMFFRSIIAAMAGVFSCGCGFVSAAHSQSCTLSVTNVAFGSVDVTANAAVDTTATFSINCGLILLGGASASISAPEAEAQPTPPTVL
jgi:hypothetical protein